MKIGSQYTREDIHKEFGGGLQVFAPHKHGRVTCLCLDPARNPDSLRIILPEGGVLRDKMVEMITTSNYPIPTFLKCGGGYWKYEGEYEFEKISRRKDDIFSQHHRSVSQLENIKAVIYMKKLA